MLGKVRYMANSGRIVKKIICNRVISMFWHDTNKDAKIDIA